ncbi:hypothetical protein DPEC_G00144320 [Dallia pectoralis]|uniref:Uncharacterized protein n=1 Tax=Dallia pectoralis TaxID=75939 RepID=A0ACC2GP56_DALPE|nr:hypothetical protein DPEC_G00144320 [Dallia pectoralis]
MLGDVSQPMPWRRSDVITRVATSWTIGAWSGTNSARRGVYCKYGSTRERFWMHARVACLCSTMTHTHAHTYTHRCTPTELLLH